MLNFQVKAYPKNEINPEMLVPAQRDPIAFITENYHLQRSHSEIDSYYLAKERLNASLINHKVSQVAFTRLSNNGEAGVRMRVRLDWVSASDNIVEYSDLENQKVG